MKSAIFLVVSCMLACSVIAGPADLFSSRIINGIGAQPNQFPWQATVEGHRHNASQLTLCGGALISSTHIITAAHCVNDNNIIFFKVGLGSNNRSRPVISVEINPNEFNVRNINPLYNPSTFANDLAILRLPLTISGNYPFLAPIRLPALSQANDNLLNFIVLVSGFGRINDNQNLPPSITLQYARTRIINLNDCVQFYGSAVANTNTLCTLGADFATQGPCSNDNGGPLILQENSGNTLVGVSSFISTSGCSANHPAGYARLGPHIVWASSIAGVPIRN